MRAFVTGATGFIGSHVARHLVSEGCEVIALVRRGADRRRLADLAGRLHTVEGDLADGTGLRSIVAAAAPDVCLHLAWSPVSGRHMHSTDNLDGLSGGLNLLRALDHAGCAQTVFAGSAAEYYPGSGRFAEDSPIYRKMLYGATKHALWLVAETFGRERGWRCATARLFPVYGPWEPETRLVPLLTTSLLAGKSFVVSHAHHVRDFLHVEDVASALWTIARQGLEGPINVGSSTPTRIGDLARAVARIVDREDLLRLETGPSTAENPAVVVAAIGRLRTEARWTPRYDLHEGLLQTVEWWRAARDPT